MWGPDPDLTPVGEGQAQSAKDAWMRERQEGIPLPEAMYCSPFRRAIRTCLITFGGWLLQDVHGSPNGARPIIVEVVPSPLEHVGSSLKRSSPLESQGDFGSEYMRFKKRQE